MFVCWEMYFPCKRPFIVNQHEKSWANVDWYLTILMTKNGDISLFRVPTDMESQEKPTQGTFFYFSKTSGNIFLNAHYHEIKKYHDFHHEMSKIIKEIYVQVREKVREIQGTLFKRFLVGTLFFITLMLHNLKSNDRYLLFHNWESGIYLTLLMGEGDDTLFFSYKMGRYLIFSTGLH